MINTASIKTILQNSDFEVVLTDFFGTLVHRKVHPNYAQRLWAKILIREFGLRISTDTLYFIRRDSSIYLKEKLDVPEVEVPYESIMEEVFKRMVGNLFLKPKHRQRFMDLFERADLKSETSVQFLNERVVDQIRQIRETGLKVYLVSDFYGPETLFWDILKYHDISELFDGIFCSASMAKSKLKGTIYPNILESLELIPAQVLMMGDDRQSDCINAEKYGIKAIKLPHKKFQASNSINSLGNDRSNFRKVINAVYSECRSQSPKPYAEYILLFHVFIERLYERARRHDIKNLFFLSREGVFLKKLFDYYQEKHVVVPEDFIKTHYLRMSRQSSFQIAFKPLEEESFPYLKKRFKNLSILEFLSNISFNSERLERIVSSIQADAGQTVESFFESKEFSALRSNRVFIDNYESHRLEQRAAFKEYLNSFKTGFDKSGMHVVDVGWGGTMQESLFEFFEKKIPVTGYYLGLRDIYNITPMTSRSGLLFSILPDETYSDHILMANTQLYEQLLSADHGSALGYDSSVQGYTVENHREEEKIVFEREIKPLQDYMFSMYKKLLEELDLVCYSYSQIQNEITSKALKTGLLAGPANLEFINKLSAGFFQNVGNQQIGISYNMAAAGNKMRFLKKFLIQPETVFRYLVKMKPLLYRRNKFLAVLLPMRVVFWHFKLNRFVRERILNEDFS